MDRIVLINDKIFEVGLRGYVKSTTQPYEDITELVNERLCFTCEEWSRDITELIVEQTLSAAIRNDKSRNIIAQNRRQAKRFKLCKKRDSLLQNAAR